MAAPIIYSEAEVSENIADGEGIEPEAALHYPDVSMCSLSVEGCRALDRACGGCTG